METTMVHVSERPVRVPAAGVTLNADWAVPDRPRGMVVFAHGSGSSRRSSRNRFVAEQLQQVGLATLRLDLLTEDEGRLDELTAHLRFDIGLLASRLVGAAEWLARNGEAARLPVGFFGASTGAAAALVAAARRAGRVAAVVSRGGRPDLAGAALPAVKAPTLLIVGGNDGSVISLNRRAFTELGAANKALVIVPGAGHLFEEPGALEEVARHAADWFARHMNPRKLLSPG
jgi:dienelactone hydrolase